MYTVAMGEVKRTADPGGPGGEAAARIVSAVREAGFAVAPGLVPAPLVSALVGAIDAQLAALDVSFGENPFLGERTRRIFNLLARDPVFRAVPILPAALEVVEALLDPECLLSSMTAIEMHPGQAAQPLHCDDGSHGLPRPGRPWGVVAIWALTDFTVANGGTRVVPGSHRFERIPRRGDDPETIAVEMPAGSVLFYDAGLWHGGGANASDARRLGIVVNYCAGFLRQEECQLLALPREQVAEFPSRLRRLVGYGTYRGLLGHVDRQSPERLVDPTAPSDMVWSRIRR
ncbi:MAG: phytanoyl-CoA dioxygenase family protein [Myxococcota bacterium]